MKKLKANFKFSDKRGLIIEICKGNKWRRMNYLFCKRGSVRGAHYHKKTRELFFIIDGLSEITIINIKRHSRNKFIAREKDIFIVEPYEAHYIKAVRDSRIIALLDKTDNIKKPDIYSYEKYSK